ncbi:serpin-like protein [Medicago truncatula]|uniref:Serpin-like protein n=1 Tax=Medicago truncatula TaxID=3880 RepID=G7KKM0_MEDTR|nr:serpin-like protein [Medicago truncatula]
MPIVLVVSTIVCTLSYLSQSDNNIVFSPLSLQVVLSIIAFGSEGPTQQQLFKFLQSKSIDHLNYFASQLISVILFDASPVTLALADGGRLLYPRLISDGSVFNFTLLDQRKPLSTSNGFGVQLTETISTAKWFWSTTH